MEKLKLTFLIISLVAILICFGASVWLYMEGFGYLYAAVFFLALIWQTLNLRNYLKQQHNEE